MKRPLLVSRAALPAILAAVLAGAPQAQAQVIERSFALATAADGAGGLNAFFGDTFTGAQRGSSFADLFTFAVAGIPVAGIPVAGTPFDASASLTSSFLESPGSKDLLITGLSLYRYNPRTLAVIGNAVAGVDLTGFGDHPVDVWSVTGLDLASGSYAVRVDGQVLGAAGGSFGADLTVSPVPEPPFYAMLLMGLAGGALALAQKQKPPGKAASG